jgi:hypothetical protein
MKGLMAGLEDDDARDTMLPLLEWCAAACVRSGSQAAQLKISQLDSTWVAVMAPDRKFKRWVKQRVKPFIIVPVEAPAPTLPHDGVPQAFNLLSGPPSASKIFSEMEHDCIRAACSLNEAEYAVMAPPIYASMLQEGCTTMNKIDNILNLYLANDPDDDDPVDIFMTSDMVTDMKDLRFGFGGDTSYATCHRGVSPFAVSFLNQEEVSKRKRS